MTDVTKQLADALEDIIKLNRQHAKDQYGDANKAESWSCIRIARTALEAYRQQSCELGPICLGCEPKEECKPTGWQPIETAPKDGTSIDLWVVNKHYPDSAHRVPDAQWKYEQWSVVYTDETGWDYVDVEGHSLKATHWMPIPNGPEKS